MKYLDHLEEWIITFLIGAATLVIFVAVMHRYAAGLPIPGVQDWLLQINLTWAQELCIIMFVWMAKFGAAYGVRTGIHVGVDVLINSLSGRMRAKFIVFGMLAGALFTGIIATLGGHFVWENGAHYAIFNALGIATKDLYEGPTTPDLEWPTWPPPTAAARSIRRPSWPPAAASTCRWARCWRSRLRPPLGGMLRSVMMTSGRASARTRRSATGSSSP